MPHVQQLPRNRSESLLNDLARRIVEYDCRRCAFSLRVDEREHLRVAHVFHEVVGILEVLLGLAGEPDDDVGRKRYAGARVAELVDEAEVVVHGVHAVHGLQNAVGSRLCGQVQGRHEVRQRCELAMTSSVRSLGWLVAKRMRSMPRGYP